MGQTEYNDQHAGRRRSLFDPIGLIADAVVPSLTDAVDVDDVIRRVDVDDVVRRIDIDDVIRRIDFDVLLSRVDIDAVMARVDIDAIVDRVDIERLVQRADLGAVMAQSTRGLTGNMIDLARRQIAGIDEIVTRVAARLVRRDPANDPDGPPASIGRRPSPRRGQDRPTVTGHYAGPVARAAAFGLDVWAVVFLFGVFTAMGSWMLNLLFGDNDLEDGIAPIWSALLLVGWSFVYFVVPLTLTGRTFGKGVVGLRVVSADGTPLPAGRAFVRVLVLPVSIALLGLGLLGAVFGRRRSTLHDVAARSAVVIDWGDRPADLPIKLDNWLTRRDALAAGAPAKSAAKSSS